MKPARRTASVPYGTETMHVLRAEKGFIIVGQETDGTVTPDDAGLAWAIGKAKKDFVGKRSLTRAAMVSPDRKQLVGLKTVYSRDRAAGRGADRRRCARTAAYDDIGSRHLVSLERRARSLDRPRPRRSGRARIGTRSTSRCPTRPSRSRSSSPCSSIRKENASTADALPSCTARWTIWPRRFAAFRSRHGSPARNCGVRLPRPRSRYRTDGHGFWSGDATRRLPLRRRRRPYGVLAWTGRMAARRRQRGI